MIDVTDQNDQTWFDRAGNFHSDKLRVEGRYTRTSPDMIAYEATIEDPSVFTGPWKIRMAPGFYAKLGFQKVAEIPDKPLGHTEIVMRLPLRSPLPDERLQP